MPPDPHVNPAEEPSPTPSPGRPEGPAPDNTVFMPGVPRDPTSRIRIQPQVTRIGRLPDNDIIVIDPGVSAHVDDERPRRRGHRGHFLATSGRYLFAEWRASPMTTEA